MNTKINTKISTKIKAMVQLGSNPSIPPDPEVTPEFDTVDFDDTDFETGETT